MDAHAKPPEKLAYQVNEAVHVSGLGRTTIYELIKAEKLKTVKAAGRRLITGRRSSLMTKTLSAIVQKNELTHSRI